MTSPPTDVRTGDEAQRLLEAPDVFEALIPSIQSFAGSIPADKPVGFLGCGSSFDVPQALAECHPNAVAVSAADFEPHPDVTWVAVTRSGATREVLEAMKSGVVRHVITCVPQSAVTVYADHVLNLESAIDSGLVAVVSTLVTAQSVAMLLGASSQELLVVARERVKVRSLTEIDSVAWLGPWQGYALGREFVRKSIETGRRSSFAHTLEFLHGDDQMYGDGSAWIAMDHPLRIEQLRQYAGAERAARVVEIGHDWKPGSLVRTVSLLTTGYQLIFGEEAL